MINKISAVLTKRLINNGHINKEDEELYLYGFFILISQLIFFIIVIAIGLALSCLEKSILFYISYRLVRKYAGGYHASTELRCEIMSTSAIFACICIIKLAEIYDFEMLIVIFAVLSSICIFLLSPLDTPEKPLSQKENSCYKNKSRIISLVILALIVLLYVFKLNAYIVSLSVSLILEGILLIAGKIKSIKVQYGRE